MTPFRDFICPRCGAPHFGSEFPAGIDGPQVLHCHGRYYDGCGWQGSWEEVEAGIEKSNERVNQTDTKGNRP